MASNGLYKKAKNGKCHICQRVRSTNGKVKAVGEVHHGFAIGHIWECIDAEDCEKSANKKIKKCPESAISIAISNALRTGRIKEYIYRS